MIIESRLMKNSAVFDIHMNSLDMLSESTEAPMNLIL